VIGAENILAIFAKIATEFNTKRKKCKNENQSGPPPVDDTHKTVSFRKGDGDHQEGEEEQEYHAET